MPSVIAAPLQVRQAEGRAPVAAAPISPSQDALDSLDRAALSKGMERAIEIVGWHRNPYNYRMVDAILADLRQGMN